MEAVVTRDVTLLIACLLAGCGGQVEPPGAVADTGADTVAEGAPPDTGATDTGVIDTGPPAPFAGCTSAKRSGDGAVVEFGAADPTHSVLIYGGRTDSTIDFGKPLATVPAKSGSATVPYDPCKATRYVCRVRNAEGFTDANANVVSPSADAGPCFAGLVDAKKVALGRVELSWDPASDDLTPGSAIVYEIHQSTTAGGEDFTKPSFVTKGTTKFELTSSPSQLYWVVRAVDGAGQRDGNKVEKGLYGGVVFSTDVEPFLVASCATGGCHQGSTPAAGFTLEKGKAYKAIVGVPSSMPGWMLVTPGDPSRSTILYKLNNPIGHGPAPYAPGVLDPLRAWVVEGAKDL